MIDRNTHNSIGKANHPYPSSLDALTAFVECSRRDDLESLAYMFIYFIRGNLPWRRLHGETVAETWDIIRDVKKLETEQLLTLRVRHLLQVYQDYLRNLFRGLAAKHSIEYDFKFDWVSGRPNKTRKRHCAACHAKHCQTSVDLTRGANQLCERLVVHL